MREYEKRKLDREVMKVLGAGLPEDKYVRIWQDEEEDNCYWHITDEYETIRFAPSEDMNDGFYAFERLQSAARQQGLLLAVSFMQPPGRVRWLIEISSVKLNTNTGQDPFIIWNDYSVYWSKTEGFCDALCKAYEALKKVKQEK